MPTITDATVVAQAYDTSGNGGRKTAYLSNGWIVTSAYDSTGKVIYFQVDKRDGNGFTTLCNIGSTNVDGRWAISNNGNTVHILFTYTSDICFIKFDATNVTNTNLVNTRATIDSQGSLGNVSLAINEAKTELHATWSSKNSTYSSSFNIRYAKGAINADGTVTWGAVEQITQLNNSAVNIINPSIICINNKAYISVEYSTAGDMRIYLLTNAFTTKDTLTIMNANWGSKTIYSGGSYAQSSPSAIFVPQSINGLANGRIWVAWHGTDVTDTTAPNIRVAYSDDLGVTWSAMQKLTSGNVNPSSNASLTANKVGKISILYGLNYGTGSSFDLRKIEYSGTWGTSTLIKNTTVFPFVSTLYDLSLNNTEPLFIYKDTTKVGFYGTWTVTTISVTPGDIGQKTDKNNILSYSITTDGTMSTITEKINGTVVNTRTANSGDAITLGLTQAQWDAIRFGRYADATGGRNTLTVEMGTDKWTYTFDKRLATDADILSATKAVKDSNEVYLPAQISRLADAAKGKGAVIPANPKIDDVVDGIKNAPSGRVLSGIVTSSNTSTSYEYISTTGATNACSVSVTGLTFKPKRIFIKPQSMPASNNVTEYHYGLMSSYPPEQVFVNAFSYVLSTSSTTIGFKADLKGLSVTNTGFVLPVTNANTVYEWTAYEN